MCLDIKWVLNRLSKSLASILIYLGSIQRDLTSKKQGAASLFMRYGVPLPVDVVVYALLK
jgi:hypothetical protein